MSKKLLSIVISLIIVLAVVLVFSNIYLERGFRMPTYPFEASIWEKLLANISQIFDIGLEKRIEVDLSRQKMKIFEGGRVVGEFLVSTGRPETPTPTGRFKVYNKSVIIILLNFFQSNFKAAKERRRIFDIVCLKDVN